MLITIIGGAVFVCAFECGSLCQECKVNGEETSEKVLQSDDEDNFDLIFVLISNSF